MGKNDWCASPSWICCAPSRYQEYIIQRGNGITPWMKTKPTVWLNVTLVEEKHLFLPLIRPWQMRCRWNFCSYISKEGKVLEHCKSYTSWSVRECFGGELFGTTRTWGQMHLLFCYFYSLGILGHLLSLCIYLSYCQYLKCMKNTARGLNTNLLTFK